MNKFISICVICALTLLSCNTPEVKEDYSNFSIKELNSVLERDSLNTDAYILRAQKWLEQKNIDKAIDDYQKAIKINDTQFENYLNLGDLFLMKGKSEKARQSYESALEISPNNTDILLKLGVLYALIDDYLKSFEYLNQGISIDPYYEKYYYYKGQNYLFINDTTRAIEEFQKAVATQPKYTDAYIYLGQIYSALKDTIAEVYFKNAIDVDSTEALSYYGLAFYYQETKKFNKAIQTYLDLLEKADSTFSVAYYNIGYIYLIYSDDFDSAIEYFDKAIAIDFDYTDSYINKAYALELKEEYNSAFLEYQTALKLSPNNSIALEGLKRIEDKVNIPKK